MSLTSVPSCSCGFQVPITFSLNGAAGVDFQPSPL